MKIAWIGTGVMGKPMALNLKNAGFDVHVYNRTYEKALTMKDEVTVHKELRNVVENADYIFSIVGYPKDVLDVHNEIFKYAKKGSIIVDMTTSSPTLAKELYERGTKLGFKILDAPVTGGDLGAINGTLSIMVGGEKEVYDKTLPLLEKLGKTINYMGKASNGQHAKLANQASIAGAMLGVAESLAYANEKGIDLNTMLNVITGGSASSWQAVNNGKKIIEKDFNPGFYIKHFLKDLNLILEEVESFDPLIVRNARDIYEKLSGEFSDLGTQAVIKYYIKNYT